MKMFVVLVNNNMLMAIFSVQHALVVLLNDLFNMKRSFLVTVYDQFYKDELEGDTQFCMSSIFD